MKRLLVQACLMVGSVLIFGVAANAQISQQYRAEVPFDFHANGVAFTAGDYSVGPLSSITGPSTLAILDRKTGKKRLLGQAMSGGDRWNEKAKLVFLKTGGSYTLSQIVTPTFELKMKRIKTDVRIVKNRTAKSDTVSINLH